MADEPIAPFGVTVAMVGNLLKDASIPSTAPTGIAAVIVADVQAWLTEATADVLGSLDQWTTLSDERQDSVTLRARAIVVTRTASVVEAARFPERQRSSTTSYADVLWDRYEKALTALAADVARWVDQTGATSSGAPGYSFPDPVIVDGMYF